MKKTILALCLVAATSITLANNKGGRNHGNEGGHHHDHHGRNHSNDGGHHEGHHGRNAPDHHAHEPKTPGTPPSPPDKPGNPDAPAATGQTHAADLPDWSKDQQPNLCTRWPTMFFCDKP